jgi:ATP citrate (pro-S)-lyase
MHSQVQIDSVSGTLKDFILEPFTPHEASDEYYLAVRSLREGDEILFHHAGGTHIGDVEAMAKRLFVPISEEPTLTAAEVAAQLLTEVPADRRALVAGFITSVFHCYVDLNFASLEINPFVVAGARVVPLDLAARLDDTAAFESGAMWGPMEFPAPFGRELTPEEEYIKELDAQSGASLKLTILNPQGRIWTMIAGGGASIIYADTISDMGYATELANYGEYSGDPSEGLTYEYARTILALMTRQKDPRGKVLIIGGGIANYTNVANTFKGIVRALREYHEELREHHIKMYVRRGGPNYQEGLLLMRDLGRTLGLPIEVYGPEAHMTSIVSLALEEST